MNSAKTTAAWLLSILAVVSMAALLLKAGFHEPQVLPLDSSPGVVLWVARDFETALQGLLILGGVFAILMLLNSSMKEVKQ